MKRLNHQTENHGGAKGILQLTINSKKYDWTEQYITGAEIRKLGDISEYDDIFLQIREPWTDELISDELRVDLARPAIEHFFSKERKIEFVIIVNGVQKKWDNKQISFKDVVILEYGSYDDNPNIVYTVAYEDGPKRNPEGSMVKGSVVFVKNKMIFHATKTDKS